MKRPNVRQNIRITMAAFIILFSILALFLIYSTAVYGETWFATPYNLRINAVKDVGNAGNIYDRMGRTLAYTDGVRQYADDYDTRLAVAHVVGDQAGNVLGAETTFAKYIYGFDENVLEKLSSAFSGAAKQGNDITLTIDAQVSRDIYRNMDYNGAVVVMNYKTGEVLASVSNPSFDAENLEEGGESRYVNRATMGRYPPGSTMKILTAAAAVEAGIDFSYTCTGQEMVDGQRITCPKEGGHGEVTLQTAFEKSCNTYFGVLAGKLSSSKLTSWANRLQFNTEFNFSDLTLYKSVFESSNSAGDMAWAAIGQYNDLITPMHNCMIAAAVANDGKMLEPKLLKSVSNSAYRPDVNVIAQMEADTAAVLREYMRLTVAEGTGTSAQIDGFSVCGKTGTAEYTEEGEIKNHSWFVGFIDDDAHPLAVSVILEGAGYGSAHAAPLARQALVSALEAGY